MPLYFENEEVSKIASYSNLSNLPTINGVTIVGSVSLDELGIGSVFDFKGTVQSVEELPSNAEKGDVYVIEPIATSYIYTGSKWIVLGKICDLSNYVTYEELNEAIFNLERQVDVEIKNSLPKKLSDLENDTNFISEIPVYYVKEEDLQLILSNYVGIDTFNTLQNKSVTYTDISTEENTDRKAIVLKNHDVLLGTTTQGGTEVLAMMSKYDVADFGSKKAHTNLNTQQIVTINDTQAIATDVLLERLLLNGDNVNIVKTQLTDPDTSFKFNAYTFGVDLSKHATTKQLEDAVATLTTKLNEANEVISNLVSRVEALESATN